MLRPAFRTIELFYGCHDATWEIPDRDAPIVVTGPNGTGKTTLIEGTLRTLFGYDRRRSGDAARLDARRPWDGDPPRGVVTLTRQGETYRIRRDFETDRVRVDSPDEGVEHFEGDGNPGGRNQEARRYRSILTDLLGLQEIDAYACTLFVRQGGLTETRLGEHLLRVASGGHARVDAARREIAQAHRAVTRRPIRPGANAAVNARELEKLNDEVAALDSRLRSAREAGERRGPLALERERVTRHLEQIDDEIGRLEEAQAALARAVALEAEGRHLREWSRMLDRLEAEVRRDGHALGQAGEALERAVQDGRFPADFAERLARAELRWRDLAALRSPRGHWPGILGLLLLGAAAAIFAMGQTAWAAILAGAGAFGAMLWLALRLDANRRSTSIRRELDDTLAGVPAGEALGRDNRHEYLDRFEAQRTATRRLEEARLRLADTLREARSALREAVAAGIATETPEPEAGRPADRLADRLSAAADAARDRLGSGRAEMDRVGDASLRLPEGVPPMSEAVAGALQERRQERSRVQQEIQRIGQELMERGTPTDSASALETALASLLPRREALLRKAEVLEAAHALIADAYDAFREKDQERLVRKASDHARSLSDGVVGPVVATGLLEDARVRTRGRLVPMDSPPLSFGELHALLLGVRIGAADFLGGVGVLPPLIIDEPFAHLDRGRARSLWELLRRVATERQVIVATQDALLLDHLDITPDIELAPPDG